MTDRSRRTRVLLVGRGAPERGGIPTFLDTLTGSELAAHVDMRLLNLGRPDVRLGGKATAGNARRSARDAFRVWQATRARDVVHLHTAFAPSVTALRTCLLVIAARLRGGRVVVHVHGGLVALWMTTAARQRIGRMCLRGARRVVAVSTGTYDALSAAGLAERVSLMDNAVDIERFTRGEDWHSPPRVLFVGGLTPRKGVLDLIEASRELDDAGIAHEMWLVGGTPDEGDEAEALVRAAAGGSVRFLGQRTPEQMPDVYRAADVFCLPSWYEAMPLSVLEAMASGLPVVATLVGDISRAVEPESCGLLVPARSPAALAAALREVLTDGVRARELGRTGRRTVQQRFALPRLVDDLRELYADLGTERP